jgi:hypothetical protein
MWKLSQAQRLEEWRRLREQMGSLPLDQALEICVQNWCRAPQAAWYLDTDAVNNWPDPWTLIQDNYYCSLAKALGMLYTIHLCTHGAGLDLSIRIYQDTRNRTRHNLVWIDQGKYVLNSEDAWVLNKTHITPEYKLLFNISSADLKLDRY